MKTLIVYYSRSGTTRKVAEELKTLLSADVEEITEPRGRGGPLGWLRSGKEGSEGATPPINTPAKTPTEYDLVILGTPVWAAKMSSPMRTYLTQMKGKLPHVAFFCTCGNPANQAFDDMEQLTGKPAATMAVAVKDVTSGVYRDKIKTFAEEISK
ncbi:MAG: NAD(P)H-dependent oxidoreductase [Candidatus Bathyarchaeota archaeon]|nr:NAD(P)H-dependent oxidoreductase [Candidatus Bathyarchaeota archaeon]